MNPVLLVVLENNHLLLHTEKVNYSFGTLHKAFFEVLSQIELPNQSGLKCLILGFGAGSIAQILFQKLKNPMTTGVEADPKVIELAKKWFGLDQQKLQIVEDFAEHFVSQSSEKFDLILVDLFIEEKNAACCLEENFWQNVSKLTNKNGKVIVNKLSGRKDLDSENEDFEQIWQTIFPNFEKMFVNENVIYIGIKS